MWLTARDTTSMKAVDIMAPANAARIRAHEEADPNRSMRMIMTTATHILAPEEMPSTKGPAMGLPKNVCRRKPDKARAPPRIAACRILGMRIFQIILTSDASPCFRNRILRIFPVGMLTLPVLILRMIIARNAAARTANTMI